MDSILISGAPILTVYQVDSLPSAPPRTPVEQQHLSSSKDSEQVQQRLRTSAGKPDPQLWCAPAHTQAPAHRDACGRACGRLTRSLRSCPTLRLPPAPSFLSTQSRTVENLSTVQPHKLRPCFQVPTDSQGLWGVHEQYLNDPWAPGHAVLCVWKPERSFTHSRSHARSLKVRFFRSQSESSRTIHVGGRTDTTNRLSENHL